ncbi:MAG: S26 family signal peptidase [Candidatus Thermoplasmatota archaeon]|nr:S26 family signal peptidase [Candidatus Thermoplasmatota archaeon]
MSRRSSGRRRKSKRLSSALLFARDAGIALLLVVLILFMMYAYTGLWPPLVVVESNSMMHGEDNTSHIGTIDTGDLVLVREVTRASEIETYVDGVVSGHRSYGDYGDVVIYRPGGTETRTPIIHRAIIYLQFDPTKDCYRSVSLRDAPEDKWSATDPQDTWDNLTSVLRIYHVGWNDLTVNVDIAGLIPTQKNGFITKGDRNSNTDQMLAGGGMVEVEWIVGKARGEIPWFGLLKLWTTDSLGSTAPENSVRNLWISMILIVVTPVAIDIGLTYKEKRAISRKPSKEQDSDAPYYKAVRREEVRAEAEPSVEETEEPPKQAT